MKKKKKEKKERKEKKKGKGGGEMKGHINILEMTGASILST